MRTLRLAFLTVLATLLLATRPAVSDEFGELPKQLDVPSGQKVGPDFRDLLREMAPVGKAEAAAPAASTVEPSSPRDEDSTSSTQTDPTAASVQPLQRGLAAWYQHAGKAANGESYDANGLTAAHRTLPLGTLLRVVSEITGKEVTVRVTDRVSKKALSRKPLVIELSRKGAEVIGLTGIGMVAIYEKAE